MAETEKRVEETAAVDAADGVGEVDISVERRAISRMSVREVREHVAGAPPEPGDPLWGELSTDPRKGVREICARLLRERAAAAWESSHRAAMRTSEEELWATGARLVAGVDEAGRGPLAGPVTAAAVILPRDLSIRGIEDSKKLTPEKREELFVLITSEAVAVGVSSVSEKVIDEINILKATQRAMREAVAGLGEIPDHVLVDGNEVPNLDLPQTAIHGGDESSTVIAAASIVAKVTRDRLLLEYDEHYPGYGFAQHKGYGTPEHLAALTRLGPCEIHRRSFRTVLDADGGFSEHYLWFRSELLDAGTAEELEAIALRIARVREELASFELSKLRSLYKRCYVRAKVGMSGRRWPGRR
jgi:ribonuclease HII